jgi:hypothetical protein
MTDETIAAVQRLLRDGCPPMGSYAMGAVSALMFRRGSEPTPELLSEAAQCESIEEMEALCGRIEGFSTG